MKQESLFPELGPTQDKNSYKNTNHISGKERIEAEKIARAQESNLVEIYKKFGPLSPSDAWRIHERNFGSALLTSIRRGITNLANRNILRKTDEKKKSVYNSLEHIWEYPGDAG